MNRPASFSITFVAVCALFSLLAMFVTSFSQMNLSTVKETRSRGIVNTKPEDMTPSPGGMATLPEGEAKLAVTEQQADELTELMRKLQSAPNDGEALRRIGEIFIAAQDWNRAEVFLGRVC